MLRPIEVSPGIWSTLGEERGSPSYDNRARAWFYDSVIATEWYNRTVWGTSRDRYREFEERALRSSSGWFLNAGCGSLVFTHAAFATQTDRPGAPMPVEMFRARTCGRKSAF